MEISYRLKFVSIWQQCINVGMSSADARLYSSMEMEKFYEPNNNQRDENNNSRGTNDLIE